MNLTGLRRLHVLQECVSPFVIVVASLATKDVILCRVMGCRKCLQKTSKTKKLLGMGGGGKNLLEASRTVKSCIKAAANVQFFKSLVRLLFKCGCYSRAAHIYNVLNLNNL